MNEEIGRRLREAAEAHQPDRERMLARVHRGVAGTAVRPRPGIARSWPKVVLAGSAAAGILAVAGFAVAGSGQTTPARPDGDTTLSVPTTSASASPSPTGPASPPAQAPPSRTSTGRPSSSTAPPATPAAPAGARVTDGPLAGQGAIDPHSTVFWTQSTLTFDSTQPLTALVVEVRIVQTGGVESTGQWQTAPTGDFTVTAQEKDGAVVFRWELRPGRTVPAAQQIFAVQFNHGGGARDARLDSYRVEATAADGGHTIRGTYR